MAIDSGSSRSRHATLDQHDQRRAGHQHDIERQNVEIEELMAQQDQSDMGFDRALERRCGIVPFENERVVEIERAGGGYGQCDFGDDDLRDEYGQRSALEPQKQRSRAQWSAAARNQQPQRPAGEETNSSAASDMAKLCSVKFSNTMPGTWSTKIVTSAKPRQKSTSFGGRIDIFRQYVARRAAHASIRFGKLRSPGAFRVRPTIGFMKRVWQ